MRKHTIFEFPLDRPAERRRNVRVDVDDGLLAPVGDPTPLGRIGHQLLAMCGDKAVSSTDTAVYVTLTGVSNANPVKVADAPAPPRGAFVVDGGVMLCFGSSAQPPARLIVGANASDCSLEQPLLRTSTPRLVRVDDGLLTAPLPARQLKGVYSSHSATLTAADAATLTADYAAAYASIVSQAAARHRFVQPVITRVTARDSSGRALYVSAPVMLAPAAGVQCARADLSLGGDDFATVRSILLRAVPFSIRLELPADLLSLWSGRVVTVEVEVSPQIHPVDLTGVCDSKFTSSSTDPTGVTLTLSAPGIALTERPVAADGSEFRRRVEGLLSRLDSVMLPAFTANIAGRTAPFTVDGIYAATVADGRRQTEKLVSLLAAPAGRIDSDSLALLTVSYPHRFGAECGCISGDTIIWGGLTAGFFDGYPAAELATGFDALDSGTLAATTVVTLDDGRQLVTTTTLSGTAPTEISPLLTYPHPRARQMRIMLGQRSLTVNLRPTACGRMAYALTADCRPAAVDTFEEMDMHIVPAADSAAVYLPDTVAAASADNPLRLTALTRCGAGAVTAVAPAVRSGSTLDYGRRRFCAFTSRGTCSLGVTQRRSSLSASLLDERPVLSAASVCLTEAGVVAVAGGDLIRIRGHRIETLTSGCAGSLVGWNASQSELWVAVAGSADSLILNTATDDVYIRSDIIPSSLLTASGRLLVATSGGLLYDFSTERPAMKNVRMVFRTALQRRASVTGFCLRMIGSNVLGTVRLTADNGAHSDLSYRLVEFVLDGSLDRPIEARVYARPFRYVTLTIEALVAADTRLHRALFTAL